MAIAKQVSKSKPVCKVTFLLSSDVVADAKEVALLGEFNGWAAEAATKLKKQKDGSYKATVELETGKEYAFRYLLDGTTGPMMRLLTNISQRVCLSKKIQ